MAQEHAGGIKTVTSRFSSLPADCISTVISFTSPRDACVAAAVSRIFRSAAQSDIVWERFLPPEYPSLIPRSRFFSSKKELYLALCDEPVLIDDGRKSFWLEKSSGKKCYMLSARDLTIIWGDTPMYWRWISIPESRFEEVAELCAVCWFKIDGRINAQMLSPGTHYSAYVVFKITDECYGFEFFPINASVGVVGMEVTERSICFDVHDPEDDDELLEENMVTPNERRDGWMEIELGEFFSNGDDIEMSVWETRNLHWKSGLIIQGIEVRPRKEEG